MSEYDLRNGAAARPTSTPAHSEVKLTCLADVQSAPVQWIWKDYLAHGKLTLLGGDPGVGKSLLTIDAAARLSTGGKWPFGERADVASTIFLCSEDGMADTVKPRVEAAGANASKLFVLSSTIKRDGKQRSFTLQHDLDLLTDEINRVGDVSLVVLDAITSYMGKIENNSTTDVRGVLDPIAEWAEGLGVGVLGVTHPPKATQKNAMRQFTGSYAYVAAPRLAFYACKEPDTDRTLLLGVKNNVGEMAPGRGFRTAAKHIAPYITAPFVQWDHAPVHHTADQALAANDAAARGGAMHKAKEFLQELLADGSKVDAKEGHDAAMANGISEKTLERARKELGVKSTPDGFQGTRKWSL
jgi:hypothetical protein